MMERKGLPLVTDDDVFCITHKAEMACYLLTQSGVPPKDSRKNSNQNICCSLQRRNQRHRSTLIPGEGLMVWQVVRDLGPSQMALVKKLSANAGDIRDVSSILGWKDPLEESKATDSSVLAWRIHMDRGAWRATVHSVAKNQT